MASKLRFGTFPLRRRIKPESYVSLVRLRSHSTTPSSSSSVVPASANSAPDKSTSPQAFSRAQHGPFYQEAPRIGNQWLDDPILPYYFKQHIPSEMFADIEPDMRRFGDRVATDILDLHHQCEANPPRLQQYDAWGKRVDNLVTCEAWKSMKRISAEEGLVAIAYEMQFAQWSRLYQIGKSYLFNPSSGLYMCPLSMTDGAATTISTARMAPGGTDLSTPFSKLTSRNPNEFWTSGQWMTERGGGSDVGSGCETLAIPQPDGSFRLHGFKWFSSATDSDMAMTLARIVDDQGPKSGSAGLSMFYLPVKANDGALNNMEVVRLKNKLGTRQLPTAELLLDGTFAHIASSPGRGVASISPMLTVTRLHNSLAAASTMRRIVNVAKDYAHRRKAFGKKLVDHPLHAQTLARMEMETRAATLLVLEVARHLGVLDASSSSTSSPTSSPISVSKKQKADLLLRILTPLMKLYTAKQAIACVSEGLESLGGQGYIEDTGYPGYLRDAQVLSIWEGTTNVLSLDILRALTKTRGKAVEAFFAEVDAKIVGSSQASSAEAVKSAANDVAQFIVKSQNDTETLQVAARDLSYSMAKIFMGSLMIEFAGKTGEDIDFEIAKRWCLGQDLSLVSNRSSLKLYESEAIRLDRNILLG